MVFCRALVALLFLSSSSIAQNQIGEDVSLTFEVREWTDKSGGFKVRAKLSEIVNQEAKLLKLDGSIVSVPIEKLSLADQAYCVVLKKRVDGELEELLNDGLQNDLTKSQEIILRLIESVDRFKASQRDVLRSNDTLARKSERLDDLLKSFGDELSKVSKRQLVCHAEILGLEFVDTRSRNSYKLEVKLLDLPGAANKVENLNGAGDEKLTKTFVRGAVVKLRGSLVKTKSTFETIPIVRFNKKPVSEAEVDGSNRSGESGAIVTIPFYVSSIQLLPPDDAAILKLK